MKKCSCFCLSEACNIVDVPHYTIRLLPPYYNIIGFATACSVGACKSWPSAVQFIAVDMFAFIFRLWLFSGNSDEVAFLRFVRRQYNSSKAKVPAGMKANTFRGYDFIMEDMGNTVGFLVILLAYPVAVLADLEMLLGFLYPSSNSFW